MSKAKNLLNEYLTKLDRTAKTLSQLQERAERVRTQRKQSEATESRIEALESEEKALRDERQSLQADYATAMFEGNTAEQRNITNRRKAIDGKLEKTQATISTLRESENEPDPRELAEIAAQRDSIKIPSYTNLLEQLREALAAEKAELSRQVQSVGSLHGYDQAHYRKVRSELDSQYRSEQAAERFYARKDAERREKMQRYGRGDSTDAVHESLGTSRTTPDGTMR